jgi:hypothetical protein
MYTPLTFLRSTEYHIVEASDGPWIGCHGFTGLSCSTSPAASSWS